MYRGVVIEESLSDPAGLGLVCVLGTEVIAVDDAVAGQSTQWTLTKFEVADNQAHAVAAAFSESLRSGPWYVDMNNGEHVYVAFADRCFSYHRGDVEELTRAREHARCSGIPESQIDWATPT